MTALLLTFNAIAFAVCALSSPVDFATLIWVLNTTIWVIGYRQEEMAAEEYKELYESESKKVERLTDELAAMTEEHKQLLRKVGMKVDD